ncbi:MAG: hypothetical protein ABI629_10425 [bacterium]
MRLSFGAGGVLRDATDEQAAAMTNGPLRRARFAEVHEPKAIEAARAVEVAPALQPAVAAAAAPLPMEKSVARKAKPATPADDGGAS